MPTLRLTPLGSPPDSLVVTWSTLMKTAEVTYEGTKIHDFRSREEMAAGHSWTLASGDVFRVCMIGNEFLGTRQIEITHNGIPVPGSPTDPEARIRGASFIFYYVMGASIVIGLIGVFESPDTRVGGIATIVEGALFGALGHLTMKRRRWALITGTFLYFLETAFALVSWFGAPGHGPPFGLIIRFVLFFLLLRACLTFRDLARFDTNATLEKFR